MRDEMLKERYKMKQEEGYRKLVDAEREGQEEGNYAERQEEG